jgi:hypothetical protein
MRTYAQQRRALKRATDYPTLLEECRRTVREWNATSWPDTWSDWQRALDDLSTYPNYLLLEELVR